MFKKHYFSGVSVIHQFLLDSFLGKAEFFVSVISYSLSRAYLLAKTVLWSVFTDRIYFFGDLMVWEYWRVFKWTDFYYFDTAMGGLGLLTVYCSFDVVCYGTDFIISYYVDTFIFLLIYAKMYIYKM